jgi:hypothetical protein
MINLLYYSKTKEQKATRGRETGTDARKELIVMLRLV